MTRQTLMALVATLGVAPPAAALEVGPGHPGVCGAELSGRIAAGDTDLVRAIAWERPADWGPDDGRWKALCLDSPGGSFTESLRIATYLVENRIGTVIGDGASCTAECALLFMFGTAALGPEGGVTHRQLHANGTLAFLRPAPGGTSAEVTSAMLTFYSLAAGPQPDTPRPRIDADLVATIAAQDRPYRIDTVNEAGRWGIHVSGFAAPALSDRGFFHACQNLTTWPVSLVHDQMEFARNDAVFKLAVSSWTAGGAVRDRYDLQFASRNAYECAATVAAQGSGDALPLICGRREDEDIGIGPLDCRDPDRLYLWAPIPPLALFPADTPLVALADGSAQPVAEETGMTELTRPTPCRSQEGAAEVINVGSFTSLRAGTSHETAKIDELPLGSTWPIDATPVAATDHPDHAECSALCDAANAGDAYDRDALGACVQENWMWFAITGPKGKPGYASARYLKF